LYNFLKYINNINILILYLSRKIIFGNAIDEEFDNSWFLCYKIIKDNEYNVLDFKYTIKGEMIMSQKAGTGISPIIKKRISVSRKRQITIPIDFFKSIGIEKEVDCYIQNNAIVIRPVREGVGEFDEQILADLISQGFSGQELLDRFKDARKQVRSAVENMLEQAKLAAEGKAKFYTPEDVFGKKDK